MLDHLEKEIRHAGTSSETIVVKRIRSLEGKLREFKKLNPTAGAKLLEKLNQIRS